MWCGWNRWTANEAKSVKKQKWNDILAADDKISTHGLVNSEKGNETNCCLCTQADGIWKLIYTWNEHNF